MKKKVFFILSSLTAGGSERVFWLLTKGFDKSLYEVTIVLLDTTRVFYSYESNDVKVIDLGTIRASRSFFKLYKLIKKENPYAIFTTGGQINVLVGFLSLFVDVPCLIARQNNILGERMQFDDKSNKIKIPLLGMIKKRLYKRFHTVVCQSEEMKQSVLNRFDIKAEKLALIPNPIMPTDIIRMNNGSSGSKRLIIVGRLVKLKGHERLLKVLSVLPKDYILSIAGDGPLKDDLLMLIEQLGLRDRVNMLGRVRGVEKIIADHDLLISSSFTEGFPNVVIEALSVGTPVVTFKVGGISSIIKNGVNGYIVEQGDLEDFKSKIIEACNKNWNPEDIKEDANQRFSINHIVDRYQKLIV